MDLQSLRITLQSFLDKLHYKLYDLDFYKQDGEDILSISIDEHLDLNEITELSHKISDFLDEIDLGEKPYLLDISSAGLERKLRHKDDLDKAIGSYVMVKTKTDEIYGELLDYDENNIALLTKNKNLNKKLIIQKADVIEIRTAVKF